MKNRQIVNALIIILLFITTYYAINQFLEMETMIINKWLLLLGTCIFSLITASIISFLIKKFILKNESLWRILLVVQLLFNCLYLVFEHKPEYRLVVPMDYQGEIKLFVTKNGFRDFNINKYGVGYIDKETFDRGFYPSIFKGEDNITLDVRDYFKSSSTSVKNVTNSFEYLSFYIGGTTFSIGIDSLIKLNAIDTSILPLKIW